VGDALGGPVEFMSAAEIGRKHGRVTEMIGGGWLNLAPGAVTDDTQMTLCLAESLVELGTFDPEDIAARFWAWFAAGPADVGNHTRTVLERTAKDGWKNASTRAQRTNPSSAGNGSVMRCAPVALFDFQNTSARIEHSRVQSEITHAHQECQWGCALVNSFIAHCMASAVRDPALERAIEECRDSPGNVLKRAQLAAGKETSELNPSGYVLDTIDCALWAMMNSDNFEEAVVAAVNMGGDADTVGAVCGAMAGAFYGERDIPARWLEVLQGRDHLTTLADTLYDRHHNAAAEVVTGAQQP
jgi:ADP-ribosyl-[dinitrogen reductase] hydrolase